MALGLALLGARLATRPPANAGRALRDFSPQRLGVQEQQLWQAYYERRWPRLFAVLVRLSGEHFGLSPLQALYAGYLATRAQVAMARHGPRSAAVDWMRAFYALAKRPTGGGYDPARAAEREIHWWAIHRAEAHRPELRGRLEEAFTELYVELYQAPPERVQPAARARARAVVLSDAWLAQGMPPASPLLEQVRDELVASYTALRDAIASASGEDGYSPRSAARTASVSSGLA